MPKPPELVFFDMDHTLIDNDCDVSWKEFLIDEGLASESELAHVYRYFQLYEEGRLPQTEFLEFQLRQFAGKSPEEMAPLALRHFEERVAPKIFPQAKQELSGYLGCGTPVLMLTATNRVVAEPLARALGMTGVIATEPEMDDGAFTGRIVPPYCFQEGKVVLAEAFCRKRGGALDQTGYFGDSGSDIPMMLAVGHPVAVNPSGKLDAVAREKNWPIRRWSL